MKYRMDELYIGQRASHSKTISETDIYLFAGITGDYNPAHVNTEYAKHTFFKERIAHGMLSASLISTVLGTELPGVGSIYLSQNVIFLAPVKIGDTITATVEVKELFPEKNRVLLHTYCTNQKSDVILDGEALIMLPKNQTN